MALSSDASALDYVRAMIGDTDSTDYYLTNAELDYLYANKANGDTEKTIAWALRQMCAKAFRKVARTNTETGNTVQNNQEREAICTQAEYWAKTTGILGSAVTTGSINLGIDEEDSEFNIT
jgi:hypothetical protein